jgi:imidazoleglycerol-phosphate dehydratase
MPGRTATIHRKTRETEVRLSIDLDTPGGGGDALRTGVGFLDHMLDHVARHGRIGLTVHAAGDTQVDDHHTTEDIGIVLGSALLQALGEKRGVERYGFASVPMDDALARVSLDLSGRPALVFDVRYADGSATGTKIGGFDTQLVREFFNAVANHARMNCHIEVPHGMNDHHIVEAIFKAFGRALRQAIAITGDDVPSTKGSL